MFSQFPNSIDQPSQVTIPKLHYLTSYFIFLKGQTRSLALDKRSAEEQNSKQNTLLPPSWIFKRFITRWRIIAFSSGSHRRFIRAISRTWLSEARQRQTRRLVSPLRVLFHIEISWLHALLLHSIISCLEDRRQHTIWFWVEHINHFFS